MKNGEINYSHSKTVAKGAGLVFIGLIVGRLIGYLTRLVIARYMGPAEYGILVLALSAFSIASVIGLVGLQGGLLRFVPEFVGKNENKKIRSAVYYCIKIALPLSIFISVGLFFSADFISKNIFHESGLTLILQIIAASIPFNVVASVFLGAIMGLKKAEYRILIDDTIKPFSRFIFLLVAVFIGFGLAGAATAYLISFIIAVVGGLLIILKLTEKNPIAITKKEMRCIISYSWPMMFTSVIFIVMGQIDSLMIGFFKVASDVGVYNSALPTVETMVIIPVSMMALFLPVISELHSRQKLKEIGEMYKQVVKWILIGCLPLLVAFTLLSAQILGILFGDIYVKGAVALSILSVGYFVSGVLYPSYDIINLHKKTRYHIYISVFAMSLNVILNYFLIPVYGIIGAAIATSITYTILALAMTATAYKLSRLSPFSGNFLRVLVAGGISSILLYILVFFIRIDSLFFVAIDAIVFLAAYCILLLVLGAFNKEDLEILKSIQNKTGIRISFVNKIIRKFVE